MQVKEIIQIMNLDKEHWQTMRESVAQRIKEEAGVRDPKTGYIFCPNVNHLVDLGLIEDAAEVAIGLFIDHLPPQLKPQKVLGVANRGREFAQALGSKLKIRDGITDRILQGEDDIEQPREYYDSVEDWLVIKDVPSFTQPGEIYTHFIRGVRPADRVLLSDDFLATGTVMRRFRQALANLGIPSVAVALVAKDFPDLRPPQIGYQELKREGEPVFAVVRAIGMENGRVIVTAEDINL